MGIRGLVRRVIPRRSHPLLDAPLVLSEREKAWSGLYDRAIAAADEAGEPFIACRFHEGLRWRRVVEHYVQEAQTKRVLDVGAGNGAIELAFAAPGGGSFITASVERCWNLVAPRIHEAAGASFRRTIADADTLPFPPSCFDVVVCLETIEHFIDARSACREMVRVLRPGGVVLVTTPPRWRYALRADPHFGVPGLVLLPPSLQRRVARNRGHDRPDEYVGRIYSSVGQIARLFRGCIVEAILTRSRAPRRWFWDAIVLRRSRGPVA